jgi:hypothetical protein
MTSRRNSTLSAEARRPLSDILFWIDVIAVTVSDLARLDIPTAVSRKPDSTNDCAR